MLALLMLVAGGTWLGTSKQALAEGASGMAWVEGLSPQPSSSSPLLK